MTGGGDGVEEGGGGVNKEASAVALTSDGVGRSVSCWSDEGTIGS